MPPCAARTRQPDGSLQKVRVGIDGAYRAGPDADQRSGRPGADAGVGDFQFLFVAGRESLPRQSLALSYLGVTTSYSPGHHTPQPNGFDRAGHGNRGVVVGAPGVMVEQAGGCASAAPTAPRYTAAFVSTGVISAAYVHMNLL